jgi:hypothetical protein
MADGANIGDWLEKNPDVRDRVAALAKNPDDALALRGDLNIERSMGARKNAILGGPNTAERLIEHESTKPMVTTLGDVARNVPLLGKAVGGMLDNTLTRRLSNQTRDVMGEVGKVMTRTGTSGIEQTYSDIERMLADDAAADRRGWWRHDSTRLPVPHRLPPERARFSAASTPRRPQSRNSRRTHP